MIRVGISIKAMTEISEDAASQIVSGVSDDGKLFNWFPAEQTAEVEIDYPLTLPVSFSVIFTDLGTLLWHIAQKYKAIYAEEDATAKVPVVPMDERGKLKNRNQTHGKYGIWGHDLDDLWFEGVEIENAKVRLLIGS